MVHTFSYIRYNLSKIKNLRLGSAWEMNISTKRKKVLLVKKLILCWTNNVGNYGEHFYRHFQTRSNENENNLPSKLLRTIIIISNANQQRLFQLLRIDLFAYKRQITVLHTISFEFEVRFVHVSWTAFLFFPILFTKSTHALRVEQYV